MKTSTKRIFAVAALVGATLCASPTDARKAGNPGQTVRRSLHVNLKAPLSIDVDTRDSQTVGLTAIKKDGRRIALKPQSKPTCATSCPAGKTLHCWEDEEQMMSICECGSGGGGGGFNGNLQIESFTW